MPTRGGARVGRASWRRKHAGLRGDVVHVPGPHLGPADARDDQPGRNHERPITPDAGRPPRHVPDPTHESRVLVVLHPLSPPAASSDDPGDHAHRRSPRKCLVTSLSNPPSHRHHPRLGRRNMLQRTPPHHPLPQHLGLTPNQHVLSYNPVFG